MVTLLEVGVLLLAVAVLFGAYRVVRAVKPFVWNAVVGLVVLLAANYFGLGVAITPLSILVCAVAGLPGALLVVLLAFAGVAFAPAVLAPVVLG